MLPLPFSRRQIRHSASVTLLAWLFALLSGVVNACLVQPGTLAETHTGRAAGKPVAGTVAEAAPSDGRVGTAEHHAGEQHRGAAEDSGKAGCLKFCADEASALAKNEVSPAVLPGLMLLNSVHRPLATPLVTVVRWQPVERPASVGPPLFLRLLRLTT